MYLFPPPPLHMHMHTHTQIYTHIYIHSILFSLLPLQTLALLDYMYLYFDLLLTLSSLRGRGGQVKVHTVLSQGEKQVIPETLASLPSHSVEHERDLQC